MKVLIICMPERVERGTQIAEWMQNNGFSPTVVPAVVGRDENVLGEFVPRLSLVAKAQMGMPRLGHYQFNKAGAIGCYASHLKCLQLAAQNPEPTVIVEDDFLAKHQDTADRIRRCASLAANGVYHLVSFAHKNPLKVSSDSEVVRMISPWFGTLGYVVSNEGARLIHHHLAKSIEGHVDAMLGFVAMTTAQEETPVRMGITTRVEAKNDRQKSLIGHNLTTWLGWQPSELVELLGRYYDDPERHDLFSGERRGQSPHPSHFALIKTADGYRINDMTNDVYFNVYRGTFFHPGCILGLMALFFIMFVVFLVLFCVERKKRCK